MPAVQPEIKPIGDEDLSAACDFWRASFRSRCPADVWRRAFEMRWAASKPNNGFMMKSGAEIVGALGAIYSDQEIDGRIERFCNMTSWYVSEPHRSRGLLLLLQLIRQDGYTFTNLSASPDVEAILRHAGFDGMSKDVYGVPHLVSPVRFPSNVRVLDSVAEMASVLPPTRRQICLDHAHCRRSTQVAIGTEQDGYCHVMFTVSRSRRVPSAIVHDLGIPRLLKKFWSHFAAYALYKKGALVSRIEARLLDGAGLPWAVPLNGRSGALYLSRTVGPEAISRRYTEAMVLTGC